jgi:hypothetical protein
VREYGARGSGVEQDWGEPFLAVSRLAGITYFPAMIRLLAVAVVTILAGASSSRAQQAVRDTVSAPIHDVKYEVTFLKGNAERQVVDVAMTFTTAGTAPVLLSLPAWTPGA